MRRWAVVAVLVLLPLPAQAADLSKVDRTVGKEPAYKAKPKYCLVVFGPEARDRVWLVVDGDVLYVDRSGDGDLTARDARVPRKALTRGLVFEVGTVPTRHGGPFVLEVQEKADLVGNEVVSSYTITCRPQQGRGQPQRTVGVLVFADRAAQKEAGAKGH
jgi:hypothetical protein